MTTRTLARIAGIVAATLAPTAGATGSHAAVVPFTRPDQPSVVVVWNNAALEAVRRSRLGPPMVARALAIAHTCMYDAWTAYDSNAVDSLESGQLRRPRREHTRARMREAVSVAAHRALVDLFPAERALFDATLGQLGYGTAHATVDRTTPSDIGRLACDAVLRERHADGSNQLGDVNGDAPYSDYTHYAPVNTPTQLLDPNRWQPLTFANGQTPPFLAPHWRLVTPFALPKADAFRPSAPPMYPDARYTERALALVRTSAALTDRQKMISEYWSDGPASETPPGHWNLLAQVVARRDRHTLREDVTLFLALNNALLDASIAAWDAKTHYDFVRPISAIRFLFAGQRLASWGGPYQGTQLIDGRDWRPYQLDTFVTPPFAEFVSGHSTFSAAAAEILKRFTGRDGFHHWAVIAPGSSRIEPGLTPRTWTVLYWPTFSAAADEAGLSRRLGGIHFADGDLDGRALGRRVGRTAWHRARALVAGACYARAIEKASVTHGDGPLREDWRHQGRIAGCQAPGRD